MAELGVIVGHLKVRLDYLILQHFRVSRLFFDNVCQLERVNQLMHVPIDHHRFEEVGRHNLPVILILIVVSQILDYLFGLHDALSEHGRVVILLNSLVEDVSKLCLH